MPISYARPLKHAARQLAFAVGALALIELIGGERVGLPDRVLGFALAVAALLAGGLVVVSSRLRSPRGQRAWGLIGAGVAAQGLGHLAIVVTEMSSGDLSAFPGVPDIFLLASYPLMAAGMLLVPHRREGGYRRLGMILDGGISALALGLLVWVFALESRYPTIGDFSPGEVLVGVAYPLGDLLVLGAGMVLLVSYRFRYRLVSAFVGGFILLASADVWHLRREWHGPHVTGTPIDGLWLGAYALFAYGAYRLFRDEAERDQISTGAKLRGWVTFVMVALVVASLIFGLTVEWPRGVSPELGIGVSVLSLAFIGRLWVALQASAASVEAERRQIISVISHELRTPIAGITGFLDLLEDDWDAIDEETKREMVSLAGSEATRLARLVNDLVQISRGGLHGSDLDPETFDVGAAVRAIVESTPVSRETSIRIDIPEGIPVHADRQRLAQIIGNLLTNADRYGGDQVEIRARRHESKVRLELHDSGPGVQASDEMAIWERYQRGTQGTESQVPGSGLGLALVKSLVEAHGGTVGYRPSELLGGACFWFTLPASQDSFDSDSV